MRGLLSMLLLVAIAALSGCYYDPGYSYVRGGGQGGDAYYGEGRTVIYDDAYYPAYGAGPGYYDRYGYYGGYGYGYPPGVSIGIGTTWHGGGHRERGRDHDWRHHEDRDDHHGRDDRHREYRNDRARRGEVGSPRRAAPTARPRNDPAHSPRRSRAEPYRARQDRPRHRSDGDRQR